MNTKRTAVVAFLVASALAGFGILRPAADSAKLATTAAAQGGAAVAPGAAPSAGARLTTAERDLHLGASFQYDVTSTHAIGNEGGATLTSTTLGGRLSLTVVGAEPEGARVRGVLAQPTRTDTPAQGPAALQGLATPFFFVLRADGSLASFHFPKSMSGDVRRQLRAIVSSMQLVLGPGSGINATWERTETDETGQYVASYERSAARIVKTKLRYDLVRTPGGLVAPESFAAKYETRGASSLVADASGWPATIDENGAVAVAFQGGRMAMTSKTTARLVSRGEDRSFDGSFEAAQASFDPDVDGVASDAALAGRNADLNLVGNATFGSLVSSLDRATDSRTRNRSTAQLGALFTTNPEAVSEARKTLLTKGTSEKTGAVIASALGRAGTPEAQRALADVLGTGDAPIGTRSSAAISLGLVPHPTEEAKSALTGASKSSDAVLAETSTLALGNLAKASAADGSDASDVVSSLLAKLEAAQTTADKVLYLDALGNSGDARALTAITARTTDASIYVRAAAVGALRFQKGDGVVASLFFAAGDPETVVRRAALSAVAQQDVVPSLPTLEKVLAGDPEATLRVAAVRVLARAVNTVPAVEPVLAKVAANDADASVRDAATQALSRPVAQNGAVH
jgi:HEAT repeat protein